jgi:hypothetical protein
MQLAGLTQAGGAEVMAGPLVLGLPAVPALLEPPALTPPPPEPPDALPALLPPPPALACDSSDLLQPTVARQNAAANDQNSTLWLMLYSSACAHVAV